MQHEKGTHSVLIYGLGARLGWDEATQRGAELTLPLNLLSCSDLFPKKTTPKLSLAKRKAAGVTTIASDIPSHPESKLRAQLSKLPGSALYELLRFHRLRKDMFHTVLFSSPEFSLDSGGPRCPHCVHQVDPSPLSALGFRLVWMMEQDASGKSILDSELADLQEGRCCFEAKCSNPHCQRKLYDAAMISKISKTVRKCIEGLPTSISNGE